MEHRPGGLPHRSSSTGRSACPRAAGRAEIAALLAHYGPRHPDHPMTAVLREGLDRPAPPPGRRRRRR